MPYADNRRKPARGPLQPRNIAAADRAREHGDSLVVSFVGDTPWRLPTVYCDSGKTYLWECVRGLQVIVAVRPGVAVLDALRELLALVDSATRGYPVLVDVDAREVACVVEGSPVGLWQVKRGTDLWRQYFPEAA